MMTITKEEAEEIDIVKYINNQKNKKKKDNKEIKIQKHDYKKSPVFLKHNGQVILFTI